MTIERLPPKRYPKVEIGRRAMAFATDFLVVWLVSSFLGSATLGIQITQIILFIFAWLVVRVIVPYNNQGQSLGRWAFDSKVLDVERGRVPGLQATLKREAITCLGALLVSVTLGNIWLNPTAIVLLIPLAIDCGAALTENELKQALHDRFAKTMVVSSQRGYSLDVKVRRLIAARRRNMRK
jgi:uncharacterized RDD family membrane protein YckC